MNNKTHKQIKRIASVITEDPDIIVEANAEETQRFKELITNITYSGQTAIGPIKIRVAGVEREYFEDEDIVRTDILIDLLDPRMRDYFKVPVTEQIIQAVLHNPKNAAKIIANVTVAWGSTNMYHRWLHNDKQTPRPLQAQDQDGSWYDTRRATPEQQKRLDAYIEKMDRDMEITGQILERYGLLDIEEEE